MIIVGIETSCDETAIAVLKDGKELLSNVVSSQIDIHKEFGGVVPEIASRHHTKNISYVLDEALEKANISLRDIDAIAVTVGPGLVGALLVGVSYAKALAYSLNIPLVPVHHIEGHIAAGYLTNKDLKPPFISLVVSGGHSHIILVEEDTKFKILGKTRDDAVGEAFDKVARVIGLGYPGGPKVSKLAEEGEDTYHLPTTKFDNYDYSFSGIKTAVLNIANKERENLRKADMCKSFENNVADVLTENCIKAMKEHNIQTVCLAGGVAANRRIRELLREKAEKEGFKAYVPELEYCTDNGAMIAMAGYYNYMAGKQTNNLGLNAKANISIEEGVII